MPAYDAVAQVGWAAWMPSVGGNTDASIHEIDIVWRLGLALLLSSAIGVEREMRQKTAGLRTYTLVGVGSAVFMLVSSFGFANDVGQPHVVLDPSRAAAQIVSVAKRERDRRRPQKNRRPARRRRALPLRA
jgi:hypothetical protein